MKQWTIVTKWLLLLLLLLVLARLDQQVFRFVINQFQPQCNAYKINRAHCVRNQQPCRLVFIIKMFKFTRQRRNIDGGNMYLNLNPTTSTPHRILWHRIEGRENNSRYQKPQHPTSAVQEILHYMAAEVPGHVYCTYGLSLNVCQHYESSGKGEKCCQWSCCCCWEMQNTMGKLWKIRRSLPGSTFK